MYNARVFYNVNTGKVYRCQTITEGGAIPLNEDFELTSNLFGIPADEIGVLEWGNPENELETIMTGGKVVKVDATQTPPVLYGAEPEIIEPSDDDEISGHEFLNMVEGVL